MKKIIIGAIVVLFVGYLGVGYFLMTDDPKEERAGTVSQELGKGMANAERAAKKERREIIAQFQNESISSEAVSKKIQESINYLIDGLGSLDTDNEQYLELLYHSAFLFSFSDEPESTRTNVQRQIEKHGITAIADQAHTYIIDAQKDAKQQAAIEQKLSAIKGESIKEFVNLIMTDAKERGKISAIIDRRSC